MGCEFCVVAGAAAAHSGRVNADTASTNPLAPSVTPEQARLVQESWALIAPTADDAAATFYAHLFEVDPPLRLLFRGDMAAQRHRLMEALGLTIRNLDHPEWVLPAMRELGRRHARYGVQPAHFETVGAAFLWTLEHGLGPAFTPAVRDAWIGVYGLLAATMQAEMV
jgi:hemoglobin-like flavoprotein